MAGRAPNSGVCTVGTADGPNGLGPVCGGSNCGVPIGIGETVDDDGGPPVATVPGLPILPVFKDVAIEGVPEEVAFCAGSCLAIL